MKSGRPSSPISDEATDEKSGDATPAPFGGTDGFLLGDDGSPRCDDGARYLLDGRISAHVVRENAGGSAIGRGPHVGSRSARDPAALASSNPRQRPSAPQEVKASGLAACSARRATQAWSQPECSHIMKPCRQLEILPQGVMD